MGLADGIAWEREHGVSFKPEQKKAVVMIAGTINDRTVGKKLRVVFTKGRDLNIFNVADFNVDGQWWRVTDGEGRLYVIDPAKVNYTEQK